MALGGYSYLLIPMKLLLFLVMHFWWHYYAWHFGGPPSNRLRRFSCRSCRFEVFLGVLATQNFDEMFPQFPRPSCFGVKTFYPKRKLKTKSSGFQDSHHFQGGLDVIFLLAVIYRARKEASKWKSEELNAEICDLRLTKKDFTTGQNGDLCKFCTAASASSSRWVVKFQNSHNMALTEMDDRRWRGFRSEICNGVLCATTIFGNLFIAILLGKFHRDQFRAVGKFPRMAVVKSKEIFPKCPFVIQVRN